LGFRLKATKLGENTFLGSEGLETFLRALATRMAA
jgi:hypothetical protein